MNRAGDRSRPRLVASAQRPIELDDAVLVDAARTGDGVAFSRLFRRHADAVRTRLTRLIGPVPERDDLVQNVFIAFHRALPAYRSEANVTTYLHRIVVNAAYDHLRARRRQNDGARRRSTDGARAQDVDELAGGATSTLEDKVAARADLARLLSLLDQLSPKKRIAFVLVAVEGCSLAEAAALIGAASDTVKQRVLYARRELLARLATAPRAQPQTDEEEPS
jgi:RNA polymerase sigma-70 factor (ECF subfamily)